MQTACPGHVTWHISAVLPFPQLTEAHRQDVLSGSSGGEVVVEEMATRAAAKPNPRK
jgi:hypothetical protein